MKQGLPTVVGREGEVETNQDCAAAGWEFAFFFFRLDFLHFLWFPLVPVAAASASTPGNG